MKTIISLLILCCLGCKEKNSLPSLTDSKGNFSDSEIISCMYDTLHHFYYTWSYNVVGDDAWGENDIWLKYYPTRQDIIDTCGVINKRWDLNKVQVEIQEVNDEQLNELLSPEAMEAKNQAAYYRAINPNK